MTKKGIDVSAYQGIIDWSKAKADGIEYAIPRAGWGVSTVDRSFEYNAEQCTKLGIPFGVYWFIYATTPEEARQNALACLKTIRNYTLSYPVCADLEYDTTSYAARRGVIMTKSLASDMVRAFLNTIKAAGYAVTNYTNLDYYNRYFDSDVNSKYPLWLAYWGSGTQKTSAAQMWQYSSKGRVNGIAGNVDMDIDNTGGAIQMQVNTPEEAKATVTKLAQDCYDIPAAWTLVFDPDWYLAKYTDLRSAVAEWIKAGTIQNTPKAIAWQLFQHFYICGMNEARPGNSIFDVHKYRAAYGDLQAAFGNERKAYYTHYITFGAKEIAEGKRQRF